LVYRGEILIAICCKSRVRSLYIIINGNFPKNCNSWTRSRGVNGVSAVSTTNTNANYSAFFSTYSTNNNNIDFSTQAGVTNEQFSQQVVRVSASDLIASETNVDQAANKKVCV
jgi:hypothetical protein